MFPRAAPECVAASHGAGAAIMVIDRAYSHQPGHVSRVWQSRGAATFPSLSRCHPLVSSFDSYDLLLLHSPPVIRHASYVWRCSIILNNTWWMCILLQVHLNKLPPHLILLGLSSLEGSFKVIRLHLVGTFFSKTLSNIACMSACNG